jgi:hypothetical protein
LTPAEKTQLAATLDCAPARVATELRHYTDAATEEYVRMILGQRVLTRGQDIREYRLYLLIQHAFLGRLPTEKTISALFQTTTTQSRALLRAVMSKYQYELQEPIRRTLHEAVHRAVADAAGDHWLLTIDSENVIDALNREIASIDGTLQQISKSRGTVSTYEIAASSYRELLTRFP